MSTQNSITIVHHRNRPLPPSPAQAASTGRCHQRQAQAAALRNLPLRSIPSLATAFTPGLSDICRSPRRFTQCLRATHSHGHGRPWVSRGHSLRLPRQHHTPTPLRQHIGNTHNLTPPQPLYQFINRHLRKHPRRRSQWFAVSIGGWQSPKGIRCSLRGTPQSPYLSVVGSLFPDVTDQELKLRERPILLLM